MRTQGLIPSSLCLLFLATTPMATRAQIVWQVGRDDNGNPAGDGGGPNTSFVQENGSINALPGSPTSPEIDQQADNDYYFAGLFTTVIPGVVATYGNYSPVGAVAANEEAAERAFAGADNDLRYHFNLPDTMQPTDLLSVTFDAVSLDTGGHDDPRYGIEVYFNGVLVQPQIIIRPPQIDVDYTTPQFTLESVGAQVGPGFDNIVSLKGINYSGEGGGNWMGIDYVQLNAPTNPIPPAIFPWAVGSDDNRHITAGHGGGTNTVFVQENGATNALPGSPSSPPVDQQADDDYYFAGSYTTIITNNGDYVPVGLVSTNEEVAERAFAGEDSFLRYHFNLPNTVSPGDRVTISFDPLDLDTTAATPHYGVEVYFNNTLIQPQILVHPADLGHRISTLPFTLSSVNAKIGSGFDNIVMLRGINYSGEGGGNWMGLDYVDITPATNSVPPPTLPLLIGRNDDATPLGDGGGINASFLEVNGIDDPLPGNPASSEVDYEVDDDYYFAGAYTSVIPGNGTYTPVGLVYANEEGTGKGLTADNNQLRFHFNLPSNLKPEDVLSFSFDALAIDDTAGNPRYGVEVYFNNVLIQTQVVITPALVGQTITSPRFSAGSVNAQVGLGFDNIITIKGTDFINSDGGYFINFDYFQLNPHPNSPFPWTVGLDDDDWPCNAATPCSGGGATANFVQENGAISPLPGRSDSPVANQQSDNDYYFAGDYSTVIDSVTSMYGGYVPIGPVLANEQSAERAFAAADNDLRYHFNLPATLTSSDKLSVTFDALNLHTDGQVDPRYGIEVYFNGVLVQTQIVIRPAQLGVDYTTPEFTLASVNAQVGPGFDNIVSLKGINYNNEGGGNWMGIDYVQLNGPQPPAPLAFLPTVITNGQVVLNWTSTGNLEWAPTVLGPWTPILPPPTPPYVEAVVSSTNRFFRLAKP